MDPEAIKIVSGIVFNGRPGEAIDLDDVYSTASQLGDPEIDAILGAMKKRHLVRIRLDRRTAYTTSDGIAAYESKCIPELLIGERYILAQYRPAVVHVIVSGSEGEAGGTGFFCADYPGFLVTAAHVVRNRKILRIEDHDGQVIHTAPMRIILGPEDIDIAFVQCSAPTSVRPLRINWRTDEPTELDNVLIVGYPLVPNHMPSFFCARGEVNSLTTDYMGRGKLVVSCPSRPGNSGGPVIDPQGLVVGIAEQENIAETQGQTHSVFTATRMHLARLIREPEL